MTFGKKYMPKVTAVIDTNVLISALLRSKLSLDIIDLIVDGAVTMVVSDALFREFSLTITKPKFLRAFDPFKLAFLHRLIKDRAVFVKPSAAILACRDIKDNMLLECAVAASADVIVTGDKDLLVLNPFRGIDIVTPREFIKRAKR